MNGDSNRSASQTGPTQCVCGLSTARLVSAGTRHISLSGGGDGVPLLYRTRLPVLVQRHRLYDGQLSYVSTTATSVVSTAVQNAHAVHKLADVEQLLGTQCSQNEHDATHQLAEK